MASLFEPGEPLGPFAPSPTEFQVTIEPESEVNELLTPDESAEQREQSFRWPLFIFGLLLIVLTARLVNLQVTQGSVFQGLAKGNRVDVKPITPPRGSIIDRQGRTLVRNIPVYNLELFPAQLPQSKGARERIYEQIQAVTAISINDIRTEVEKHGIRNLEPLILRANVDRDTALLWQVKLGFVSGVSVTHFPSRAYEPTIGLAHVLGYIGKATEKELARRSELRPTALIGKTGLEAFYDFELQGREGKDEVEVDSKGQIQRFVSSEPALPGKTLELYLDKDLQQVMGETLAEGIKTADRKKGVAIALDPRNGGVLGLVSLPSFDNNVFIQVDKNNERQALFSDNNQPLFNRAIAGTYPPGSTSKPVWAVAGLNEGVIKEKTDIQTPPEIRIGDSVFPDWKAHGHADVKRAIAESNNIFFYALGGGYDKIKGLGPNKMKEQASRFGWGQPTGIDLPSEAKGLIPDPEWKKRVKKQSWYVGDSYHLAIGQGDLLLTPLQLLRAVATIGNGGMLYSPKLVKTIKDPDTGRVFPREKKEAIRLSSPEIIQLVKEGMRLTVTEGTARPLNDLPIPVAGKTGTAQFEEKGKTHAWFVGYAPHPEPTIALLVMVEGGGDSYSVAVPIAKKILTWYSEHGKEFTTHQ